MRISALLIRIEQRAFVSSKVFQILQEKFDLRLTGDDPQGDLHEALAGCGA